MQNRTVICWNTDLTVVIPLLATQKKAFFFIAQLCSLTSVVFGEVHNNWLLSSVQLRQQWVSEFVYCTSENQRVFGTIPSQGRQLFPLLILIPGYLLLASRGSEIQISRGCVHRAPVCLQHRHCPGLEHVLLHSVESRTTAALFRQPAAGG